MSHNDVYGRASQAIGDAADSLGRKASSVAAAASDQMRAAGVDPEHLSDVARQQADQLQRAIIAEIRSRPVRAMLVAAAAGLIVGIMTSR